MNISHSCVSSDSENERKLMNEEQLALKTFSTHSRTLSANISIQTKLLTMIAQQIIQYLISFLTSNVSDASYFNESDVTRFLNQFKLLSENHEVKNAVLIKKFSKYCESEIQKEVKTQKNYIAIN